MRRNIAKQLVLFLALVTAVDAYSAGENEPWSGGTGAAARNHRRPIHRRPIHAQSTIRAQNGVSTLQTGTPTTDLSGTISGFPSLPMVGVDANNCNTTDLGCANPH
jgi:hypothetical protein